jgi:hypothetical protein
VRRCLAAAAAACLLLGACGAPAAPSSPAAASVASASGPAASGSGPAASGSASAPDSGDGERALAVLRVEQGRALGGQVVGLVRGGVLQGVQEGAANAALSAPAQTAYCFSAAGTARTAQGTCTGYTVRYQASVGCNVLFADFSLEEGGASLPDGVYVGLGGAALTLPTGWDGGSAGWSADLNGDGTAETCSFTHTGDDWTMLLNGAETANFPLDGVYTSAYAAVPLDVDGDGRFEVVLALMGHNTSVWVWKDTGEILLTYYDGD